MKANMRDVAAHAGVSVATVSHVLNHTRFVAEETRDRVMDSVRVLGYVPDPTARSFKTGRRNLAGFIVPDIANPFWSTIIEAIETVLAEAGIHLLILNTKETQEREADGLRMLGSGMVDGLIVASTMDNFQQIRQLVPADLPMVFVDRTLPGCTCDTITISSHRAVFDGVSHMIRRGHSRVGYITGLPRLSTTAERLNAYLEAMNAAHLPVDEGFIQRGDSMSRSAVGLVQNILKAGCTALVVSNNVMASDVLFYLAEQDIKVGRDIDLLGYDEDTHQDYNLRRMDLISQPCAELGQIAAAQLLERISTPDLPQRSTILRSSLLHKIS